METVTIEDVKKIVLPVRGSHKGQNGRLLIIGGSHLFHAASLWALTVASRIVDLVHYCSVPENNDLVKKEFRNGIVVPRSDLDAYIAEDDVILIGPGMVRADGDLTGVTYTLGSLKEVDEIENEGILTYHLTKFLLKMYPQKQWVIDAGALQMLELQDIPRNAILTPHHGEFTHAFGNAEVADVAKKYHCIVLLKGDKDVASNGQETRVIEGGNPGMTKGGTGDVLAGLIAALACKNDPFVATLAGSFINKKAGDALYTKVGPFFNATDLANQIPLTMKELLL